MKIAVLGWGSLIWCPRELKIKETTWKEDGPSLPIEFSRISCDGRLTLVIYEKYFDEKECWVPILWNLMKVDSIEEAVLDLGIREKSSCRKIGFIYRNPTNYREDFQNKKDFCSKLNVDQLEINENDYYYNIENMNGEQRIEYETKIINSIKKWMKIKELDGVIWTDLKSNFVDASKYNELNSETAIDYLKNLDKCKIVKAKDYILNTPKQINTKLRKNLESDLSVKPFAEVASEVFNLSYFYDYRLYRYLMLKTLIEEPTLNVASLTQNQVEGIKTMLKVEQIVNAIFYCQDLVLVLLSFQKEPKKYLSNIIDIREKTVKDFWKNIKDKDNDFFKELMGINRIKLTSEEKNQCTESIPSLRKDMILIGDYFNSYYKFSTNFKHGLLLIPAILDAKHSDLWSSLDNSNIIGELAENKLFNLLLIDKGPIQKNTECVTFIVNNIFRTIVEALIVNLFLSPEEQVKTNFTKTNVSEEEPDGKNVRITPISYRIHKAKRIIPVYTPLNVTIK